MIDDSWQALGIAINRMNYKFPPAIRAKEKRISFNDFPFLFFFLSFLSFSLFLSFFLSFCLRLFLCLVLNSECFSNLNQVLVAILFSPPLQCVCILLSCSPLCVQQCHNRVYDGNSQSSVVIGTFCGIGRFPFSIVGTGTDLLLEFVSSKAGIAPINIYSTLLFIIVASGKAPERPGWRRMLHAYRTAIYCIIPPFTDCFCWK